MVAQVDKKYLQVRPWKLWPRLYAYLFTEGRPLTTKGQWFNPVVFFLFKVQKALPQVKQVKSPIFILGTGRSGSTILGLVLSMHKHVGYLNEPKALWNSVFSGEDLIGSYNRGEARYRLSEVDATDVVVKAAHRLYGCYLRISCSKHMVDKYPEMIFRVPFIKAIFPDAKLLFLSRNGYDTCQSIVNWSSRLAVSDHTEVHDWWGVDRRKWLLLVDQIIPEHSDLVHHKVEMQGWTNHVDMAVVEWIVSMREGMRICEKYPESVMQVGYENLCSEVSETLAGISEFTGLSADNVFEQYAKDSFEPVAAYEKYEIPTSIKPAFDKTMKQLGYEP